MPSNTNDYYSDNDFSGSENMSNVKNVCKNLEKKNARGMTRNVDQKTNTTDEDTQYNTNNAHISNEENKQRSLKVIRIKASCSTHRIDQQETDG